MKKFLSLVLALTMALSLVTVSAGATDFDDDGDITYQEAVTVIQGLGIVSGYGDGSFRPDEVLTRGAAAKIICNLILGPTTASALSASTAPFKDVPTTNTFAGYITYCSQQGIISGYADGTFRPTGTLSGNAFMKMLLGALGYDSDREGYTGANWQVNVIKQASGIELDDGNDDFVGSQAVTREEACLYAFNTLQATMVEYENSDVVVVGDITITGQGDYKDATNNTSTDGYIGKEKDGLMQFAERYFDDLEERDDHDDFGRPASNWVYDGDDLGTYADTPDATCVVDSANETLTDLVTDSSFLDYDKDDVLDDAKVTYNGMEIDTKDSSYEDNEARKDLAGKGDIIEAFENDDNDVDTIVIRSYTYAMIDEVDEDLSSSVQADGASVGMELVDIDGDSLGSGTYYDDHDDDDKVLNGWNSSYTEGTAIAVALNEDDEILDSYVLETVTGTPTSARAVETDTYAYSLNNDYDGKGVKNGNITVDGNRYNYAAQFTGLDADAEVDFDSEYTVYLTNEGYVLAVDGDAAVSLHDVYYVVDVYRTNVRGTASIYAQAISLEDGSEHDFRLDNDTDGNATQKLRDLLEKEGEEDEESDKIIAEVHGFYEFDDDGSSYDVDKYEGTSRYDVVERAVLADDVTSSSSVIRISDDEDETAYYADGKTSDKSVSRLYLADSTFFVGAEDIGDDLDVTSATGMMTASVNGESDPVKVSAIYDDDEALFVAYAAMNLDSAADKADIVYLTDDAKNRTSDDTFSGDLYFMDDMSLSEGVDIDEDDRTQGFYTYKFSDDVYDLDVDKDNMIDEYDRVDTSKHTAVVADDADGYLEHVVLNEGKNNTVTSVTSGSAFDAAKAEDDDDLYTGYTDKSNTKWTITLDAVSVSGATVIDTRGDDADDDDYSNDINSVSRLMSALDKDRWVVADVYVEDGDIIFVAVRYATDEKGSSSSADDKEDTDLTELLETALSEIEDELNLSTYGPTRNTSNADVRDMLKKAAESAITDDDNQYNVSVFVNDYSQPDEGDIATANATITVKVGEGDEAVSGTVDVKVSIERHEDVEITESVVSDAVKDAGYDFVGQFSFENGTITVTYEKNQMMANGDSNRPNLLNDMARFLGGLHDQGVMEIEFDGVTYVWDDSEPLKGSNWYDSSDDGIVTNGNDQNTLMKALTDYVTKNAEDLKNDAGITLTIDGMDYTVSAVDSGDKGE